MGSDSDIRFSTGCGFLREVACAGVLSLPFSPSDLVNGLVALMNSNVSSPVNLVSTSSAPLSPEQVAGGLVLCETAEAPVSALFAITHGHACL